MSPTPAAVPTATAATGRTQLRGSRIDESSQPSSSSAASSVRLQRVVSTRIARSSGGSTGASARRMISSKLSPACSLTSTPPCLANVHDLLELLDRSMNQHLGRPVAAPQRAGDLPVVHSQGEAHDQRLPTVVRKLLDAIEDARQLVAALDEVLRRVHGGEHRAVLDRRLRTPRPVAVEVRREVVGDADEPGPERAAVALRHRALEVPVGLQERLLRQVLGVVVVAHPVVGVRVHVPQVRPVQIRELAIELLLLHARQPTQAARERRGRLVGTVSRSAAETSVVRVTGQPGGRRASAPPRSAAEAAVALATGQPAPRSASSACARNAASEAATATPSPWMSAPAASGAAR